jgi:RNAse (barnase) inhibitor barstar
MNKRDYEIDGARFATLSGFYDEIERVLIPGARWGRNLDALNDILRGGFGTPEEGFILLWRNAQLSRQVLGDYKGRPLFDTLVDIIRAHGPGGEQDDGVVLILDETGAQQPA